MLKIDPEINVLIFNTKSKLDFQQEKVVMFQKNNKH